MPKDDARMAWLEAQLAQVDAFIKRDTERLSESPQTLSIQLSLDSWEQHRTELLDELGKRQKEEQAINLWFSKNMPQLWGRWWSARLLATTACSGWLHEGNQTFTPRQRVRRNMLCLRIFLTPGKLPVAIRMDTSPK